jgi:hypothetical protein
MRIEVMVGSENPTFYPINKKRILIGADPTCDIVVSDPEISRKHVLIITEKDGYYVLDQGSTNGSYMNEEPLQAGKRAEFTTYFPVRLGANVLLSLVENADGEVEEDTIAPIIAAAIKDEAPKVVADAPVPNRSESTSVLSLKELNNASTKNLVKRRQSVKKKNEEGKNAGVKKKLFTPAVSFFCVAVLVGGVGYYTYQSRLEEIRQAEAEAIRVAKEVEAEKNVKVAVVVPAIKAASVDTTALLTGLVEDQKCENDLERALCKVFDGAENVPWGVIAKEKEIFVLIDGTPYYEKAKLMLKPGPEIKISEEARKREYSEADFWEVTAALYIASGIKSEIDYTQLGDSNLKIAFFKVDGDAKTLAAYLELNPGMLQGIKQLMNMRRFERMAENGKEAIKFGASHYKLFVTAPIK